MTDQPDDLDSDQLWLIDRNVPDGRDNLPDGFWWRPVRNVKTTEERL